MSEAALEGRGGRTWTEVVYGASRWPPFQLGAVVALLALGALGLAEWAFGRFELAASPDASQLAQDVRIAFVLLLVAIYAPTAYVQAARGARATWRELVPNLRCSASEGRELLVAAGRYDRRELRRAGLVGIGVGVCLQLFVDQSPRESFYLPALHGEALLHRLLNPVIGWTVARLVYVTRVESKRLSEASRELLRVDLLDQRAAAPIVRQGMLNALLCVGLFCIAAVVAYDAEAAPALGLALAVLLPLSALLTGSVLLAPLRGVRDAVRAEKEQELRWCNEQIRGRRDAIARDAPATAGGSGLADLVAWREHVTAVREWPIDTPTAARFALYLALPLGSWLGGAMVERFLDQLLE